MLQEAGRLVTPLQQDPTQPHLSGAPCVAGVGWLPTAEMMKEYTICLITHRDSFFPLQPEVELAGRVDSQSKLSLNVPGRNSNW